MLQNLNCKLQNFYKGQNWETMKNLKQIHNYKKNTFYLFDSVAKTSLHIKQTAAINISFRTSSKLRYFVYLSIQTHGRTIISNLNKQTKNIILTLLNIYEALWNTERLTKLWGIVCLSVSPSARSVSTASFNTCMISQEQKKGCQFKFNEYRNILRIKKNLLLVSLKEHSSLYWCTSALGLDFRSLWRCLDSLLDWHSGLVVLKGSGFPAPVAALTLWPHETYSSGTLAPLSTSSASPPSLHISLWGHHCFVSEPLWETLFNALHIIINVSGIHCRSNV